MGAGLHLKVKISKGKRGEDIALEENVKGNPNIFFKYIRLKK